MKKLLQLSALLFLLPLCGNAITHVVQSGKNGCLSCTPNLTLGSLPTAGHIMLSFSRCDTGNGCVPSDTVLNTWTTLYVDNGTHGVGVFRVAYCVANGLGSSYHIEWSTSTFFTHGVGYVVETDIAGLIPTLTLGFANSNGFNVTSSLGTPFGMSVFGSGAVDWEAVLLRLDIRGGWYMGYMSTNAGSPWNGGSRMNLAGTVDYLIDTWNGIFAVDSLDPVAIKHKNQVY
jgi:hypothetical protein